MARPSFCPGRCAHFETAQDGILRGCRLVSEFKFFQGRVNHGIKNRK